MLLATVSTLVLYTASIHAVPATLKRKSSDPSSKGLVGFGVIPANARDSTGTTIGGIGSAIALKRGTWTKLSNGSYTGSLIVQPDRGYNVDGTVDFQGRQHEVAFTLNPYTGSAALSFTAAKATLSLTYKSTLLYTERGGKATTGLDALDVRPATGSDPQLPVPSVSSKNQLTLDCEALVLNADGSFWVGDEYGAYIYKFNADGSLNSVIQPPAAVVPHIKGNVNFTASINPDSGRTANQGFEAVTASPDGKKLYAMMQSALIQDGGDDDDTSRYARLFEYDVSGSTPDLKNEYVVPLPQSSKDKTFAQSDIHYLDGNKFLILSRDGHGHGDDTTLSAYKSVDIFDISKADDISGSKYDDTTGAVAPKGKLKSSVDAAKYSTFLSLLDTKQLTRFGLHNGGTSDASLIDAKWEGTALAPALDSANPDDYFLFVAADNDFNTLDGTMAGKPYSTSFGQDVDNQFLVYRVTLPMVPAGSVAQSIGI